MTTRPKTTQFQGTALSQFYCDSDGYGQDTSSPAVDQILVWAATAPAPQDAGRMWKISQTLLTEDTANIDITSIPGTFTHLKVMGSVRTDSVATNDILRMRVNNNSTADDHIAQYLRGLAGNATAAETVTNETSSIITTVTADTATARYFGGFTLWLYNYTNTSKAPHWTSIGHWAAGVATGNIAIDVYAGMLDVAGAVTRLTFFPDAGSNLTDKSIISLYGVR